MDENMRSGAKRESFNSPSATAPTDENHPPIFIRRTDTDFCPRHKHELCTLRECETM